MRTIKWTLEAQARFLAVDSRRVQERIVGCIESAARFPQMFPRAKSRVYPGLRAIVVSPFVILYDFDDENLMVVTVYHQKQSY